MIFSSIIDALTDSIQKFSVVQNEEHFEHELNSLCNKLDSVEIDIDENWVTLQTNYSKLKYLCETILSHDLPSEGKFIQSLGLFMEKIDTQTQFYLSKIDWGMDSDFKLESRLIKKCLENSLNQNNPVDKLKYVLTAYEILVVIVEDLRGEKCETILDQRFLDDFQPPSKKQRK